MIPFAWNMGPEQGLQAGTLLEAEGRGGSPRVMACAHRSRRSGVPAIKDWEDDAVPPRDESMDRDMPSLSDMAFAFEEEEGKFAHFDFPVVDRPEPRPRPARERSRASLQDVATLLLERAASRSKAFEESEGFVQLAGGGYGNRLANGKVAGSLVSPCDVTAVSLSMRKIRQSETADPPKMKFANGAGTTPFERALLARHALGARIAA